LDTTPLHSSTFNSLSTAKLYKSSETPPKDTYLKMVIATFAETLESFNILCGISQT
jgi:hypothetical protein